ncbi:hypothetical protein AB0G42_21615 [Streptomyces yangpuensis]|uniref:hypothetical protein n=1 Tax=Streptomyces yangpuensis TaxID=1648182 RepID=UPI0034322CC5
MTGYSDGYARFTGTAEEVIAELEDKAQGWFCMGGAQAKVTRAREAAQSVRDGSFSVKVGRTIYSVVGAPEAAVPDQRETRDETADNPVTGPVT